MKMKTWIAVLTVVGVWVGGAVAQQAPVPAAPAKETPKQEAKTVVAAEAPVAPPPGRATLGVHFMDQDVETFGDLVLPVYSFKSGLLFVNPRGSINDSDGQEGNIGLGYRHLFPDKNFIVGANVYYDLRDTELDNTFDQFGAGVEFLSQWVDARANYYLPEEDAKESDLYRQQTDKVREITEHWRKPVGDGYIIEQHGWTADSTYEVTSLQHYRLYEQALEGFDAEVGALLPIPVVQEFVDVKAFVGWYDFEANHGDDIQGVKARLEVRALPSLLLDATWLEDKALYGSRYSVGARASVPFDLANLSRGKNPFAGALAGFGLSKEKAPLSSRLTEMVIRDLHVRTDASDPEEIVADRRQVDKKLVSRTKKGKYHVLATDVIFVDDDNRSGNEDGSWEHPYRAIQTGVDDPRGKMVYVLDARQQYYENVIMRGEMILWGNGCPFYGAGGQFLGNGVYPVVNGRNLGPVFTLASGSYERPTELVGFEITRELPAYALQAKEPSQGSAAIYGENVTGIRVLQNYIHGRDIGGGVVINNNYMPSFDGSISGNRIDGISGDGISINLNHVSSVDVTLADNDVTRCSGNGLYFYAYESSEITSRISGRYSNNDGQGVYYHCQEDYYSSGNETDINATFSGITANDNGGYGVFAYAYNYDYYYSTSEPIEINMSFSDITANRNGSGGVYVQTYAYDYSYGYYYNNATPINVGLSLSGIEANDNGGNGVQVHVDAYKYDYYGYYSYGNGPVNIDVSLDGIRASGNEGYGVYSYIYGYNLDYYSPTELDIRASFSDIVANGNTSGGLISYLRSTSGNYYSSASSVLMESSYDEITANGNGGAGVSIYNENWRWYYYYYNSGLTLDTTLSSITADNNAGDGVYLYQHSDNYGDSGVDVDGVTAQGNGQNGINASLDAYGNLSARFTGNLVAGNTADGLVLNAATDGSLDLYGEGNVARNNGDDGFHMNASGSSLSQYDFGGGPLGSAGYNVMVDNGGYGLVWNSEDDLTAQYNYWDGVVPPVAGSEFTGNVDGDNALATEPVLP